ncbi:MAG: hypothetical protein KY462_02205 [Actinobacteria bacterium]|nr:hypothetical protein [Actinomycetota bacterium]
MRSANPSPGAHTTFRGERLSSRGRRGWPWRDAG